MAFCIIFRSGSKMHSFLWTLKKIFCEVNNDILHWKSLKIYTVLISVCQ